MSIAEIMLSKFPMDPDKRVEAIGEASGITVTNSENGQEYFIPPELIPVFMPLVHEIRRLRGVIADMEGDGT